jgi:hypothetical protein
MAAPDTLVLKRHRDMDGRGWHPWVRRSLMALVAVVPVLALFNLFGQHPSTSTATASKATLRLYAPTHLRGGLLYMGRFTITAHQALTKANLVLSRGWAESSQINTIEPGPTGEGSDNGRLVFQLGHIAAGKSFVLFMEFQVNPTNVGSHNQDVTLKDGDTTLTTIHRSVFVYP